MTLVFPIVGLGHYEKEPKNLIDKIKQAPSLQLMCDDGNPYSAYAIDVYWEGKQIGMVADDYARIIRASTPDERLLGAEFGNVDYESHKMFWATMEMEKIESWENEIRLDLTPILGIAWPKVNATHTLLLDNTYEQSLSVQEYIHGNTLPEEDLPNMVTLCEEFAKEYGCSLSGDDRRVEMVLEWVMEDVMDQWRKIDEPTAFELYEPLCHLRDIHRHYANNSERCARVYKEERKRIHEALVKNLFLSDYQTVLEARHITLRQQQHVHEQWLMDLPGNVFAFYKTDIQRFAGKLFYLRLSWQQLLAVYVHLECLELLYRLQGKRLTASRKGKTEEGANLNNEKILYTNNYAQRDRLFIDGQIRDFLRKDTHRKTNTLAYWIRSGEHKKVFVPYMGSNAKQFIKAFCLEFNVSVDYSDLKKQYDKLVRDTILKKELDRI